MTSRPRAGSERPAENGEVGRKRGVILGLEAFEKISAVEGVGLSDDMRKDLAHMKRSGMDDGERSRFILDRYGKD